MIKILDEIKNLNIGDYGDRLENYDGSDYVCDAISEIADENTDTYTWNNWTSFLTSSQGLELFALKNHVHYNNVTTAYTIRTYLDRFTGNGDYRITSNADKELYIFSGYYYNVSVNGVAQYRRSQRYYSISEP